MNKGTHMHYKYGDEDNRKSPDRKKGNAPTTKKRLPIVLLNCYIVNLYYLVILVLTKYYQLQASHELNLFFCIKGTSLRPPSGAWQKWISGHGAQVSEIVCTL